MEMTRPTEIKGLSQIEMNIPAWTEVCEVTDIERCSLESNQEMMKDDDQNHPTPKFDGCVTECVLVTGLADEQAHC